MCIYIVVGVMKMGNTVLRVGLEARSLVFRASVLPLHYVGSPMLPLYPRPPVLCVCVDPCLRGTLVPQEL